MKGKTEKGSAFHLRSSAFSSVATLFSEHEHGRFRNISPCASAAAGGGVAVCGSAAADWG
jgi:hypothetical protein